MFATPQIKLEAKDKHKHKHTKHIMRFKTCVYTSLVLVSAMILLCICVANVDEPRHIGKYETLERLQKIEPAWVLPQALVGTDSGGGSQSVLLERDQKLEFPLVLKPNKYSCRSFGVSHVASAEELRASLERMRAYFPSDSAIQKSVLVQKAFPIGVEVRIWGNRASAGSSWSWQELASVDGANKPMPPALAQRLSRACSRAWPNTNALGLDVAARSWDDVVRGDFVVLEANGSFGLPIRADVHSQKRDVHLRRISALEDAAVFTVSRCALGMSNMIHGRVSWARIAQEFYGVAQYARVMRLASVQN